MTPRTIVVVDTMGGLGDLLLGLPVVAALAATHPEACITVVTTAPWHVLLERDPRIAELAPVEGRDGGSVLAAVRPVLERIRPDLAVTTNRQHGLPELLEATAGAAVTNLWRNPPADELVDLRSVRLLVEDGWVDPAAAGLPPRLVVGPDELALATGLLADLVGEARPVLCFPDSGMAVKHWPLAAWAETVRGAVQQGLAPVVVSQVAEQRSALAAAGAAVAPALELRELAALAAAAARRDGRGIGGDTGPVRVAAASGLRVVGLFGPTLASRYGYRPETAVNLQGLPGCEVRRPTAITEQTCWWTGECPLTASRAPRCMHDITPRQVLAAVG